MPINRPPDQNPYLGGFGYTSGPAGSSGGLVRTQQNPYPVGYVGPNGQQMNPQRPPTMWAPNQAQMPYGYGTAPGQSNRGYYEQQTPVGSFAASERTQAPQQQYAQTYGAGNDYIGRTSQGIGGAQSVLPYAQQIAQAGQQANPYLGAQTQQVGSAGTNPLIGRNPYLDNQINDALRQSSDSFQATVLPQFDSMARRSGSFGNTGVEAARGRAIDNFGRNQSAMANNAYLQDYQTSQGLQENALNRNQAVNMANAGFNAGDLARNLGGAFTGQQLGMQGLSSLLGAGQFDSTMGQQGNMFNATMWQNDLSRNSQLAQQLGMFNAGNLNTNSMFNAGQGNSMNQYMAGLNQANNQFNAGSANSMLGQVRNLNETGRQFDENLDWNIDQGNWNRMRTGQQDQINLIGQLMGWNQGGIGNATQLQNLPLSYLQQLSQIGMGLGGLGASSTQQLNGNPLLGAIGGWQLAGQLFGNGGG
jgi:hypothetical protein